MDFPIVDLLDDEISEGWLLTHCHPKGLHCPQCGAKTAHARVFRKTHRSQVTVYRCRECQSIYNVYSRTVFAATRLRPAQAVLLLRGVCRGETTATVARELGVARMTVHEIRKKLQANAERLQPTTPLLDGHTETDEMFQNAGKKRPKARRPSGSAAASGEQTARPRHLRQ